MPRPPVDEQAATAAAAYYAELAKAVREHVVAHSGRLPDWVWQLSEQRWHELAKALRRMDES